MKFRLENKYAFGRTRNVHLETIKKKVYFLITSCEMRLSARPNRRQNIGSTGCSGLLAKLLNWWLNNGVRKKCQPFPMVERKKIWIQIKSKIRSWLS